MSKPRFAEAPRKLANERRAIRRDVSFDAAPCPKASLADLNTELMAAFVARARSVRGFPLSAEVAPVALLTHLDLLNEGRPTNAAVLLFGRKPQRFLKSAVVKCAHFQGTEITKPIPSYQRYAGTVFELIDHAVDFVIPSINPTAGVRKQRTAAPEAYKIPSEVVRESIVNAVAHRDYTSDACVHVMLFADRLEVWNPGTLLPPLTLERLGRPHESVPRNRLLAHSLYLARYTERMGTGTRDMIMGCRGVGLPLPQFVLKDGFMVTIWRHPQKT